MEFINRKYATLKQKIGHNILFNRYNLMKQTYLR